MYIYSHSKLAFLFRFFIEYSYFPGVSQTQAFNTIKYGDFTTNLAEISLSTSMKIIVRLFLK